MFEEIKPMKIDSSKQGVFFTSDLHFGHQNIIKFCNRPWETTEEMDEALIKNWNSVVKEDDIVFDLGDFAFAPNWRWKEILSRLNGKHYLILGNHDRVRWPGDTIMKMFSGVYQQLVLKINNRQIYLGHCPLLCYDGTYRSKEDAIWALSGHTHIQKENNSGKDFERLKYMLPTQYDVGVDFNDYKPISFENLSEKINFQVENNTNLMYWVKS